MIKYKMQGYIINFNRVKDEDLIVTVLTKDNILTMYRFYGARHSHINLGYKIDFESQASIKSSIPQLRGVLHLAHKWNNEHQRMLVWQTFIQLFYKHLKDVDDISEFYFNLLDNCTILFEKQNPKRVVIEAYVKLLEYEGRLHDEFICFNCEKEILENPSIVRSFLLAHKECVYDKTYPKNSVIELFEHSSTLFLDDTQVEDLWRIVLEGF